MKKTIPQRGIGCLNRLDSAGYLSISTRMIDHLAAIGEIPRIKIGRKTVFRISDLDRFAEAKIQQPRATEEE